MKKLCCMLLAFLLLLPIAACEKTDDTEVRVWTLNGTTGFGMAPLIDSHSKGEAALNYTFTVEKDAANVRDAIISGTADIAAVPTNVAAALYNATNGGVKVLALNTLGVLYVVTTNGTTPTLTELSGKTLYTPAQNPAFITKALLDKAKISDVILDSTTYAEPTALRDAVASGMVEYAVLPEPMVTIAQNAATGQGTTVTVAIDLTTEWNKHFTANSLVQGCVVVRTEFLGEHPVAVRTFMEEYKKSIAFVNEDVVTASDMIARAGIFEIMAITQNALPRCNIKFVAGEEMKTALSEFLAQMPLTAIGDALPTEDFYYITNEN